MIFQDMQKKIERFIEGNLSAPIITTDSDIEDPTVFA